MISTVALACLLAAVSSPPAAAPAPGAGAARPAPYVQPFGNGTSLDWLDGEASAIGRVRIFRDLAKNPVAYKVTRREAEDEGLGRVMAALGEVAVDASTRLSDRPQILDRYRKLLQKSPPSSQVLQDSGPMFRVRVAAPLRGGNSLMSVLLPEHGTPDAEKPARTAGWPQAGAVARARNVPAATGVVIDARHLEGDRLPSPALLPRIVDTDGRVVYGVESVDPGFARTYGLAVYVAPPPAGSAPPPPGREGESPVEATAVGAAGDLRSDIVIEPQAADRILEAASAGSFLKECRVVVRMPASPRPPAVEPPGRRAPPNRPPPPPPPSIPR